MIADQRQKILNSGNDYGRRCFELSRSPSLVVGPALSDRMAITRITVPVGLSGAAPPATSERSFAIGVHLRQQRETEKWRTWVEGRFLPFRICEPGAVGIYDFEACPYAVRPTGFDSVHFNLPRRTLDAFTDDHELRRIGDLRCVAGTTDGVLLQFARFVLPWLGDELRTDSLMHDYFVWMFCSHVASAYGHAQVEGTVLQGGMAPWQKRRLRELVDANLGDELRLSQLAKECGLSVSHFCRSFKRTFGMPVHRYIIARRVDHAKFLMRSTSASLAEIALESGFTDQAAFSRSFHAIVGTSPMQWRKEHTHRYYA